MTDKSEPTTAESEDAATDEEDAAATAALVHAEDRDLPRFVRTYVLDGQETLEMLAKELYVPPDEEVPMEHFARVMQQLNPGTIAKDTAPTAQLPKGGELTLPDDFFVLRKTGQGVAHLNLFRRRRPFFFSL